MAFTNYFKILFIFVCWNPCQLTVAQDGTILNKGMFDFIVVGGGSEGSILAARLTENKKYSVLLIEAGGFPHPDLQIPALSLKYANDPKYVKFINSVPERNAGLSRNGIISYRYGRGLGGTSQVNCMVINRGSPHDFDNWAKITRDSSWSYSNMLKYFKKYENYLGDNPTEQRGYEGPIDISTPKYSPGLEEWLSGGKDLGYPIAYQNEPQIISFTGIDYSQNAGKRVSSYSAYLKPLLPSETDFEMRSRSRDNLFVLLKTHVNKILFKENKAIGVSFYTNSSKGENGIARAKKEIILCAGVIGTTELLQKSGVGPKELIEKANINLVKDAPQLGENFQDHPIVQLTVIFNDTSVVFDRDLNKDALKYYNSTGDGPYSNYGGTGGQAFVTSSVLSQRDLSIGWSDIQLTNSGESLIIEGEKLEKDELAEGEVAVKWSGILTRAKSRGSVGINPKAVNGPPLINFNFLRHPDDLTALVDAIKILTRLCENTKTFQKLGCRLPRRPLPQCKHEQYRSQAYWECFVEQLTNSAGQGAGTCRMGPKGDDKAVVDTELRVIGIERLRICDSSIMPAIINTNLQGSLYAIAEKAAEMILETWNSLGNSIAYQLPKFDDEL